MSKHEENSVIETAQQVEVQIVNAFTVEGAGGNPAGVVLDADGLDEAAMQAVAARTGLSETAFVSRSASEGARLDFFTPTRRIAHCGHATVAAFAQMRAEGRVADGVTSKQTVDGPRRIIVKDGAVFMQQTAPRYQGAEDWEGGVTQAQVLASLGLAAGRLHPGLPPFVVDTGNRFLVLGVAEAADLAALRPDQAEIARISEALGLVGYYVFALDPSGAADATTRMFAPLYGIEEESATGMAAGPLACLLHDKLGLPQSRFAIEQGRFMSPPSLSRIFVDLEIAQGAIAGLMAGGEGRRARRLSVSAAP